MNQNEQNLFRTQKNSAHSSKFPQQKKSGQLKILLVEDNPGDADLVDEHLSDAQIEGLTLHHVTRLSQAIDAIQKESFDVVLLDLALPDSRGLESVERLHQSKPDLVIIVLTGSGNEEVGIAAVGAGAQDYLSKNHLTSRLLTRSIRHALERSRLLLQLQVIVTRNSDAMVVVSQDGIVRFLNPAAEKLFGRKADELIGELFGFPIETKPNVELEIVSNDETRNVEMRVVNIEWAGEAARLASLRDVTDRKRAEDLQKRLLHADRLAAIGQLAAGVAHEVNNPAAFVMANLNFMQSELKIFETFVSKVQGGSVEKEGNKTSVNSLLKKYEIENKLLEFREMLRDNYDGTQRIVQIVKDLRSFSRIERDEVEFVNLNDVVNAACNMTFNEVRHRAKLIKDFGTLPLIAGDRGKLSQVLTNLVINAAHSIEEGAADRNNIRIVTRRDDDWVRITIEDTGCGIPEEVQSRIFEPFFTTKPREHGTGLGLPLCAEIIRKHGGEITFTSTANIGTTFEVIIPAQTPMTPTVKDCQVKTNSSYSPQQHSARILVIDDEPVLLHAFRRMLEKDHDVTVANGGTDGLEVLEQDNLFDVIICDLMMPEVDGVTFYEKVRQKYPHLLERIVFCSGGAFTSRAKEFTASVSNVCLEKPVSWDLLDKMIYQISTKTSIS